MTSLRRLLLLGDSIRGHYMPRVKDLLQGKAEVVGPAENCQFSGYTLGRLDAWLGELGRPDAVHWNNGLHDAGHNPQRDPAQVPLEAYLANLRAILVRLRETGAPVVWATTTPVHPKRPFRADAWSWRNEEIDRYNGAALELMNAEGVPINDLHALVEADPDRLISADLLHLSEDGDLACAKAVVRAVGPFLFADPRGSR